MSMKNKLDGAYMRGITKERARVLWLMDDERQWLRQQLDKTILVESKRHAMQVKIQIAVSIFEQLKMRIMAGHEAPGGRVGKGSTDGEGQEAPDNEGEGPEPESRV